MTTSGWGRAHPDCSAGSALWFLVLLTVACAVCAWQDQRDLPESPNSEVLQ
jgi:hypothetical protein